jgi:hypothetical protein
MCRKEFVEWETLSLHVTAAGMTAMCIRSPPLFANDFFVFASLLANHFLVV